MQALQRYDKRCNDSIPASCLPVLRMPTLGGDSGTAQAAPRGADEPKADSKAGEASASAEEKAALEKLLNTRLRVTVAATVVRGFALLLFVIVLLVSERQTGAQDVQHQEATAERVAC